LDAQQMNFLKNIQKKKNVLYVVMGNAYLLKNFCEAESILVSYEDNDETEEAMADILLRKAAAKGKLPVTPCDNMQRTEPAPTPAETIVKHTPATKLEKVEFPVDAGYENPEVIDKLNMFIQ